MTAREQILAAQDLKKVEIDIPEWGGKFYVRELTGTERGELERRISEMAKANTLRENYRGLVAIASLVDEGGTRIFTFDDLAQVSAKSGKVLERVGKAADGLNKLSDEEVEALSKN
jgi:hypothetical protein